MLSIYDSKTRQKQVFVPLTPKEVSFYVCGMTVYDYCHIGHARTMVCFDVMVRHLVASGYTVHYVRNITDIDDKIIQRAAANQETVDALTQRFIEALEQDAAALQILPPSHSPRATFYIQEMIDMIATLIDKGYAYVAQDGDVCFDVSQYPDYGRLSGQDLTKLRAGARMEINHGKQDPLDFVLWKLAKSGEPAWPSPWGEGRPGWHIECSAMSQALLGQHFDFHGGGHDLLFPHHENEVAQSVCANQKPFVNHWLHVGFVQIDNEKMSKSLGNFFTIREVLRQVSAEVLRFFLLASHYRSPINYSDQALQHASQALHRLYQALRDVSVTDDETPSDSMFEQRFAAAMDDDFNTPEAVAVLHELARDINRLKDQRDPQAVVHAAILRKLAARLGLLQQTAEQFFQGGMDATHIDALVKAREQARQGKDWARADAIRAQLLAEGIVLEDTAEGIKWRLAQP